MSQRLHDHGFFVTEGTLASYSKTGIPETIRNPLTAAQLFAYDIGSQESIQQVTHAMSLIRDVITIPRTSDAPLFNTCCAFFAVATVVSSIGIEIALG